MDEDDSTYRRILHLAEREVQAALGGLPDELKAKAVDLPVICEPWPSEELVKEGLDPDLLGLFSGDAFPDGPSVAPLPPQIQLFLENLWDFCQGDEARYLEEVRVTYLHELGHFLGLDEEDLDRRGLA